MTGQNKSKKWSVRDAPIGHCLSVNRTLHPPPPPAGWSQELCMARSHTPDTVLSCGQTTVSRSEVNLEEFV